jgi:hypothetical protein
LNRKENSNIPLQKQESDSPAREIRFEGKGGDEGTTASTKCKGFFNTSKNNRELNDG